MKKTTNPLIILKPKTTQIKYPTKVNYSEEIQPFKSSKLPFSDVGLVNFKIVSKELSDLSVVHADPKNVWIAKKRRIQR